MDWRERLKAAATTAAGAASAAWEGTAQARASVAAQAGQLAGHAGSLIRREDVDTDGVNRMALLLMEAGLHVETDNDERVPLDVRAATELAAELAGAYQGIVIEEGDE